MALWRRFPSLPSRDLMCLVLFLLFNAGAFLFSYYFIMDTDADAKATRMQSSILAYGCAQSLIGYLGGFYIARIVYGSYVPPVGGKK